MRGVSSTRFTRRITMTTRWSASSQRGSDCARRAWRAPRRSGSARHRRRRAADRARHRRRAAGGGGRPSDVRRPPARRLARSRPAAPTCSKRVRVGKRIPRRPPHGPIVAAIFARAADRARQQLRQRIEPGDRLQRCRRGQPRQIVALVMRDFVRERGIESIDVRGRRSDRRQDDQLAIECRSRTDPRPSTADADFGREPFGASRASSQLAAIPVRGAVDVISRCGNCDAFATPAAPARTR